MFKGVLKNVWQKNPAFFISVCINVLLLLTTAFGVWSYRRSRLTRAELEQSRLQLDSAKHTCDELAAELERSSRESRECREILSECTGIVGELAEASGQSASTVRDCITIVQRIRVQIKDLERCLNRFSDYDSYVTGSYSDPG